MTGAGYLLSCWRLLLLFPVLCLTQTEAESIISLFIMPQNKAAWLEGLKKYPLRVGDAPYSEPNADQVLIKVAYTAMNPGMFLI